MACVPTCDDPSRECNFIYYLLGVIASSSSWSFHHMNDGAHVHRDGDQHGEQVPWRWRSTRRTSSMEMEIIMRTRAILIHNYVLAILDILLLCAS